GLVCRTTTAVPSSHATTVGREVTSPGSDAIICSHTSRGSAADAAVCRARSWDAAAARARTSTTPRPRAANVDCNFVSRMALSPPALGRLLASPPRLDRVPDLALDLGAGEAVDLLDARRRRDVDLGEIVADHVDADEDEPALGECWADRLADHLLARR